MHGNLTHWGGALHAIKGARIEGCNAFIASDAARELPTTCCVLSVTPLLRELMIRCASLPLLYDEASASSRMVTVMLDEIATATVENLHLPMPADRRLRDLVIHAVAYGLGYDSGPSFTTMFKKALGAPPPGYCRNEI